MTNSGITPPHACANASVFVPINDIGTTPDRSAMMAGLNTSSPSVCAALRRDKCRRRLNAQFVRCVLVVMLAIAFGYIESAVVVYLRQIFHAGGFDFPLQPFGLEGISRKILLVEIGREAATLVLIFSACLLVGQNRRQRLACFLLIFAVWDITYYVFLKIILGWPASILDWDVLFLIPTAWAGPVLAPVIVSVMMLVFAGIIIYRDRRCVPIITDFWDWAGFSIAAVIVIASFCRAGRFMQSADYATHFSWRLFGAGVLGAALLFAKCVYKKPQVKSKQPPVKPGAKYSI